jgi:glutamate N-acetyltransferase/amino-acid N-acetyltransferase
LLPLIPKDHDPLPALTDGLSWSSLPGTRVGVTASGVRRKGRDDLVVLVAPSTGAALITRSTAASAPCRWTRARVPGPVHAVVINAGNANAATGEQGERDTRATARRAATLLGCEPDQVLVCSTGVIGVPMPMDKLLAGLDVAVGALDADAHRASGAILTTDLTTKEAGCRHEGVEVAGFAKGSGMIHPDMGTMLAFLITDCAVEPEDLQELLASVSARTFEAITVDGDTSTSDTVILQATGKGPPLARDTSAWSALERALEAVCRSLARAIAADGEGAGRLLSVLVEGLEDDAAARAASRAVARSSLVKCAVTGADANWGRVVGALGAHGVPDLGHLDLDMGGIVVLRDGQPVPFDEARAKELLSATEILVHARLPGPGRGEAWGCDLTHRYVDINADYRS